LNCIKMMEYNNKYSSNNQTHLQIASYYILFPIPFHEMLENVYRRDGLRKLNTSFVVSISSGVALPIPSLLTGIGTNSTSSASVFY
jgi:hypothetical protein